MVWKHIAYGVVNSRTIERISNAAKTYLLGDFWRNYRLMQVIVHTFYPHIPESVNNRICPFCRKTFKTRAAIHAHILRTHRSEFNNIISDCIDKYLTLLRNLHIYTGSVNGEEKNIIMIKGLTPKFTSMEQFAEFLMKNPDIVKKAINR
jgi:hypothetical protein